MLDNDLIIIERKKAPRTEMQGTGSTGGFYIELLSKLLFGSAYQVQRRPRRPLNPQVGAFATRLRPRLRVES